MRWTVRQSVGAEKNQQSVCDGTGCSASHLRILTGGVSLLENLNLCVQVQYLVTVEGLEFCILGMRAGRHAITLHLLPSISYLVRAMIHTFCWYVQQYILRLKSLLSCGSESR